MSKKDKEIFESYASGNPKQRFELIYKNYRIFPKMIDSFETRVFNTREVRQKNCLRLYTCHQQHDC